MRKKFIFRVFIQSTTNLSTKEWNNSQKKKKNLIALAFLVDNSHLLFLFCTEKHLQKVRLILSIF